MARYSARAVPKVFWYLDLLLLDWAISTQRLRHSIGRKVRRKDRQEIRCGMLWYHVGFAELQYTYAGGQDPPLQGGLHESRLDYAEPHDKNSPS